MRNAKGQFPTGVSGNPGGWSRRLEKELRAELRQLRIMGKTPDGLESGEEVDGYRAIIQRLWAIAMRGDDRDALVAIKLIFERSDGLPKQKSAADEPVEDDPTEEEALEALSTDELRVIAKVRALMKPKAEDDADVH